MKIEEPDPQTREILQLRARILAARRSSDLVEDRGVASLIFSIEGERYGIALEAFEEVTTFQNCTPVPGTSREMLGIISRRGNLRAVIDLAALLGLPASRDRPPGFVLLLRRTDLEAGFQVDSVEGIGQVHPDQLSVPGENDTHFVKGLTEDGLIVLDLEKLLLHNVFSNTN